METAMNVAPSETEYIIDYVKKMNAHGYESLATVLHAAFKQAAIGKGHERHANGEAFDHQVMQDMARRFGVGALLGQAFKKSEESQRLPHDAAVRELLGAINYLAGAVIAMERTHRAEQVRAVPAAANDNRKEAYACTCGMRPAADCPVGPGCNDG